MIAVGLHINEASCDLIERSIHDRDLPASYHSYQMFSLTIVNPQLDKIAFQGAKFLEEQSLGTALRVLIQAHLSALKGLPHYLAMAAEEVTDDGRAAETPLCADSRRLREHEHSQRGGTPAEREE